MRYFGNPGRAITVVCHLCTTNNKVLHAEASRGIAWLPAMGTRLHKSCIVELSVGQWESDKQLVLKQ